MLEKLVLGTAQFGLEYGINNSIGKPSDDEVEKILIRAYNNSISFLDTAEAYGDSQKRIGRFHTKYPHVKFNIITKFYEPLFLGNFREHILKDLKELNAVSLYAYMFHNKNDFDKYADRIEELLELKKEGLINKIGVSLYTNEEVYDILNGSYSIDLIQIPFNLFDNNSKRGEILDFLKEKGIEVHTRSVFLQGLFFMKDLPTYLDSLKPFMDKIRKLSQIQSKSISSIALNYCLIQDNIDKVLIGIESEEQLINNISIVSELNRKIDKEIDQINIKESKLLNPANWKL